MKEKISVLLVLAAAFMWGCIDIFVRHLVWRAVGNGAVSGFLVFAALILSNLPEKTYNR